MVGETPKKQKKPPQKTKKKQKTKKNFMVECRENLNPKCKSVFPLYEFRGFLDAYEVVARPMLYREAKHGVAPKRTP